MCVCVGGGGVANQHRVMWQSSATGDSYPIEMLRVMSSSQ